MTNKSLYNFCGWNDTKRAQELLDLFDDIDILYEEGSFFDFAISKNNVEICKALLNYFENKQFPTKSTEYEEAKEKLKEILENATDNIELSTEMKQVLSPYLNFEDSDTDIANLSDFSVESLNIEEKLAPSENLLTEENLRILNQEFTSQDEKNSLQDVLAVPESSILHEGTELSGDLVQDNPDLV